MPKAGELTYYQQIGESARQAAVRKPFSLGQHSPPFTCGDYLLAFAGICELLHPTPSRLLDLGCGTGWTSVLFARIGYDVVGQDVASDAIALAKGLADSEHVANLSFVVDDYESLDFREQFDNVVFFDSLHHAVDERSALASAYRALRSGGICVTREPGRGHARAEHSVHAVEEFDVTEKDMPPSRIAELGFELGFSRANVYPFPNQVFRSLMRVPHSKHTRSWRGPSGWLKRLAGALYGGARVAHMSLRMYERGGLVQLVK